MIVVISGGPSVGKTSVIEELKNRGHNIIEEAARKVASEDSRFLRKSVLEIDRRLFQEAIFEMQKILFKVGDELFFSDRGFGDTLGYYPVIGYEAPNYMVEHTKKNVPDYVFILDPLPEFEVEDFRNDIGNQEELQKSFYDVYRGLGCDPIKVQVMSINDRVDFILSMVKFNK